MFSFIKSLSQHETWVLNRSDVLDIGNKNIVLYRIEFMQAIHSPIDHKYKNHFNVSIGIYKHDKRLSQYNTISLFSIRMGPHGA
jgi:hypothetical protein